MNCLDYLGFDFGELAKGVAGVLSGTGGILSGGKKEDKGGDVKAAMERQRLEDAKAAAEKKAQTLTAVGLAAGAVLVTAVILKKKG